MQRSSDAQTSTTPGPLNPFLVEDLIQADGLSYRAKGLFLRMLLAQWQTNDELRFRSRGLAESTRDGVGAVQSALVELRLWGLVVSHSELPRRGSATTEWCLADGWVSLLVGRKSTGWVR